MTSPLFQQAWRTFQVAAQRTATAAALRSALTNIRSTGPRSIGVGRIPSVESRDFETQVRRQIVETVLDRLGNVGGVIRALLRPQDRALTEVGEEIQSAMDLLRVLQQQESGRAAPQTRPAGQIGGGQPPRTGSPPASATPPPPPPPQYPPAPPGFVNRRSIGRNYTFAEDDPIVTGEMIDVISSNVHSIGFEWNHEQPNHGTLKVRFLEGRSRKHAKRVAGPMYFYFKVNPEVFMAFQTAVSKGTFVWDRLRVRGTVSGSRYHYELEDLGATDYVPRKATRLGPNEHFLKRQFTDQRTGRTHTSQLEDEFVQRIGLNRHGPQGFVPARGTPNRGGPNRGRL